MRIGTSHFATKTALVVYYRRQGIPALEALCKLEHDEVHVGPPLFSAPQWLTLDTDGRYILNTPEP